MQTNPVVKILILESQMIIAADVALQLLRLGYDVIGINARTEDALKAIKDKRPDIVLMNINIQGKERRIRTARILSKAFLIPVIFLSAHTDREIFKQVINAQPYAFITKPFDIKDLQRGLKTALDRMNREGWGEERIDSLSGNKLVPHKKSVFPFFRSEDDPYRSDSRYE